MLFDLFFVFVLISLGTLGAWRGAVVSGSGLFSLIAGYAGALWMATIASGWVADRLVVPPLMAPAIAGSLGFVVVWLFASSLLDLVIAWDRLRVEEGGRGLADRALGGFFGLARGSLIVVLLAVLLSWLDAARDLGAVEGLAALPEAESSAVAGASGNLVEAAVGLALEDAGPAAEVAARIVARPAQALGSVQTILEDERVGAMLEDRLFWTLLSNDSVDYAMNRQAIRAIVHDPEMRGRFVDLGMVEAGAREDPEVFKRAMVEVLREVAPRIKRLQHDPEMKALATDPEIIALVEAGDTLALLGNPRIRRLVDRLSAPVSAAH